MSAQPLAGVAGQRGRTGDHRPVFQIISQVGSQGLGRLITVGWVFFNGFQDNRVEVAGKHVDTAEEGSLFGEMALVDGSVRSARAVAEGKTLLVPVGLQRFKFLVQASPDFSLAVMRTMADRLRTTTGRLYDEPGGSAG